MLCLWMLLSLIVADLLQKIQRLESIEQLQLHCT